MEKVWETSSQSNHFWQKVQGKIQKFGGFLSGMIIPVIGIIIAWGLLTMFFIPTGFTPNAAIASLVGPIITYVVPLLVGFMGGKLMYGTRGGTLGAFAAAGTIWGADWWLSQTSVFPSWVTSQNMLLGAMISGPLSALLFKKMERLWINKMPAGYEMLINNFSLAFFGLVIILVAMFGVTPIVIYLVWALGEGARAIQDIHALPLLSIIIEPAKPLFLNNAIGNGILVPIGLNEVALYGKSTLFFAEANPGPGAGLLLAFAIFGNKRERAQGIGALPVQFVGGIHEVYFPFVLANFKTMVVLTLSGALGLGIMQLFGAGLIAPMSPGSVIAAFSSASRGANDYGGIALAIVASSALSFSGTWLYIKLRKGEGSLTESFSKITQLKGRESSVISQGAESQQIKLINIACDQGAGSSAIGATVLRKSLTKAGYKDVKVVNTPIKHFVKGADIYVTSYAFETLARNYLPEGSLYMPVQNFIGKHNFEQIIDLVAQSNTKEESKETSGNDKNALWEFTSQTFRPQQKADNYGDVIKDIGKLLINNGFVSKEYTKSMIERNKKATVAIGSGLAIPHGTEEGAKYIKKSGATISLFPKGIDWDGQKTYVVIGIAVKRQEQIGLLAQIATIFADEKFAKELAQVKTINALNKKMSAK